MSCFSRSTIVGMLALPLVCGCAGTDHTQRNAVGGSVPGTTAGAIIGHQSGHGPEGAVIGAVAGGLTGALVGSAQDAREERDESLQRAAHEESQVRASGGEITNADLIRMTESGLSEDVIIAAVRSRGGRFDVGPDALIELKKADVSDRVIHTIQSTENDVPDTVIVSETGASRRIVVVPRVLPRIHVRPVARPPVVVRRPGRVIRRR